MRFPDEVDYIKKTLRSMFAVIEHIHVEEAYMGGHYLKIIVYINNDDIYLADKLTCGMTIEQVIKQCAKELDTYIEVDIKPSSERYIPLQLSSTMILAC